MVRVGGGGGGVGEDGWAFVDEEGEEGGLDMTLLLGEDEEMGAVE